MSPPHSKRFRLSSPTHDRVVVLRASAASDADRASALTAERGSSLLRSFDALTLDGQRAVVRDICDLLGTASYVPARGPDHGWRQVRQAVQAGKLLVILEHRDLRRWAVPEDPRLATDLGDQAKKKKQIAWLEVRIVDDGGVPVPSSVEVRLPDGTPTKKKTDGDGFIYFPEVPVGTGEIKILKIEPR